MNTTNIRGAAVDPRLAFCAMVLIALATWLLQHPFRGMDHDAVLYTLFALMRSHPNTLGADIVVRFGSQDKFTLFSPLYAAAIQLFGMERAAALLLLASQAAFLACAGLLARRFMSRLDATVGVALLAAVPGEYGSGVVFHFLENFMTPRILAEALVMAALLAAAWKRYWIGAACVVIAMLIHPIMTAAGVAFLVLSYWVPLHPRLALIVAAVGFAVSLGVVLALAPLGRITDPDWIRALNMQAAYLFLSNWSLQDWSRAAVPLTLLAIGWHTGATVLLRRACLSALGMVACGMVITVVFGDLLHVRLVLSLQAWRWLWLANVLAFLLAPAVLQDCWQRGAGGRVAVMVLAVAWVFRGTPMDFLAMAIALTLAAVPQGYGEPRYWRLLFLGASLILGFGIAASLVDPVTYFAKVSQGGSLLQITRAISGDGTVLMALCALGWALPHTVRWPRLTETATIALIVIVGSFCVWLTPFSWRTYTAVYYTPRLASLFAPWRAAIPPQAEVLWPDTALAAWYLLERPNYWSLQQIAGGIFSRQQALIMGERTDRVRTAMKDSNLLGLSGTPEQIKAAERTVGPTNVSHMDLKALKALCADPDLQYVVNRSPLAPTTLPPVVDMPSRSNGKLYLYRCADLRPR